MQVVRVECALGAHTLSLETGKIAKQAHGAVLVQVGETISLVAVVQGKPRDEGDIFPLTVEYRERAAAAGKFPGGFIKREGRPSTKETLTSRLIDRPHRSLFPPGFKNEVLIMASVLSADRENDPDVLSMIGASAALHISPIAFPKPIAHVRVGRVQGEFIVLPTQTQLEESDLDLIVSGSRDAVCMIEGFARELPEDVMVSAILFAHEQIIKVIDLIEELRSKMGLGPKEAFEPVANPLNDTVYERYASQIREAKLTKAKLERYGKVDEIKAKIKAELLPPGQETTHTKQQVDAAILHLEERVFRDLILEGQRLDGRAMKEIRPLHCEVNLLPRVHGSALFQRGETQALITITLGSVADEQKVDGLGEEYSKKFMLDYNFPPYSVGEARAPRGGPGRREIGHGMLAERSLKAVIPPPTKFPYTIRLISDITESNGSSSMASVCGGTLALMDAGVPIKDPVAGISIGLVKEADKFTLFTDIQGDEDHYGDMDFKVAGTQRGITGIQLDLKVDGISEDIIRATLDQAREARREILKSMLLALRMPRKETSKYAPRLIQFKIDPSKIGAVIGKQGSTIKALTEATGAQIDIEDDGTIYIAHREATGAEEAKKRIEALTEEIKVGRVYEGKITSIKDFGAFVEIAPGKDGLCHISELDHSFVGKVEDVVRMGDVIQVKVIAVDDVGKVKLSRKVLLPPPAPRADGEGPPPAARGPRSGGNDRGGNDRGGDRGGDRDRRRN